MPIKDNTREFLENNIVINIDSKSFRWRLIIVYVLVVGVFAFIFLSAFQLQIIDGGKHLVVASRTNKFQERTLASRGLVYSKNGVKLAQNIPSYSLYINTKLLSQDQEKNTLNQVEGLIKVESDSLYNTFKNKAYNEEGKRLANDRLTLKSDLTFDQYFSILSVADSFPGVAVIAEPVRYYERGAVYSNIIGYIGDPSETDLKNGIYSESQVGKIGIEKNYDDLLRGKEGVEVKENEALSGKQVGTSVVAPEAGKNIFLTIDTTWQEKLSEIMVENISSVNAFAGAGVIMNGKTGEIKAMVTVPSYDNNLFANGISSTEYAGLINDPKRPLMNRPIALQLPPGSIMKIFGATAALESGTITESTRYFSNRCMDLPGNIKFCEADKNYIGWVNVKEAMAVSSNIFFCTAMQNMHTKPGYTYYYDLTKNFGIGSKTGIDLIGEAAGTLPSAELKKRIDKQPWYVGDECNAVIGQGYVTVTPLQMTVAVSAIINNGKIVKPRLLDHTEDQAGNVVQVGETEIVRNINVSQKTLDIVKSGLRQGVLTGTASALNSVPGKSVAKTGSSDAGEWINGKYYSGAHSWIMGCFTYENEEYCFTVMQQWGGRGYKTVPIMKKFINCVYNDFQNNCDAI